MYVFESIRISQKRGSGNLLVDLGLGPDYLFHRWTREAILGRLLPHEPSRQPNRSGSLQGRTLDFEGPDLTQTKALLRGA